MHALPSTATSPESARARGALRRLSLREDTLDDKLSALESKASKLRKSSQIQIQRDIFTCHAIIAPVHLLPAEILGHIFGFLVKSHPLYMFAASRVCRAWRAASMVSYLWSDIFVSSESPGAKQMARLFVERSKNAPLTVFFFQSEPSNCPWPAWSEVKRSASRWTTVYMQFYDCGAASQELQSLPASAALRQIAVSIMGRRPGSGEPGLQGQLGFEGRRDGEGPPCDTLAGSPHVQALHLSVFTAPWVGPLFQNLVTLSIKDLSLITCGYPIAPYQLTRILAYCKNLQHFAYDGALSRVSERQMNYYSSNIYVSEKDFCAHPKLKTLALSCSYDHVICFFVLLAAPNLQSVTVKTWPTYHGPKYDLLERRTLYFLVACPDIRTLHTHGIRGRSIVLGLGLGLANVESIHFEHAGQIDFLTDALSRRDRFFDHFDEPAWLAPKLTNLVIIVDPSQLNMDKVRSLMAMRHRDRSKSDLPRPLSKYIVNGYDMLEDKFTSEPMLSFRAPFRCNLLIPGLWEEWV